METTPYQLVIIGGGPAGVAAAVYAARKKIRTALVAESFGGQSIVSEDIQNWIGTPSVSGLALAQQLEAHVRAYPELTLLSGDLVTAVAESSQGLSLTLRSGATLLTEYLLVASGSRRRRLGVPGEAQFEGRGVVFCATCDAPLFNGKRVAVVGGGNAGVEAVIDLLPYASHIYLVDRSGVLKADKVTQDKALASEKVERVPNAQTLEIVGEQLVTGLRYRTTGADVDQTLAVDGVFVEIGAVPNSDFLGELVACDALREIVTDPVTQRTSHPRIWAAGDVANGLYKQNNIAAGDAIKAVLNVYDQITRA